MRHFKDMQDNIYALEDNAVESILPAGCTEITEAEATAILNPPPTDAEIMARLESAVDAHINAVAQAKGYDSRVTCALRAGYVNPWQAEGAVFGAWMDDCYTYCYQVLADVQNEVRTIPTEAELIAELPVMVWLT